MKKIILLFIVVFVTLIVFGCGQIRVDLLNSSKQSLTDESSPEINIPDESSPEINITLISGLEVLTDSIYDFLDVEVNTFSVQTLIIENTGNANLQIGDIDPILSDEFSIISTPTLLAPDSSDIIDIQVFSTVEGSIEGLLVINNNDEDENPYRIFLKANITPATIPYPDIEVLINLLYYMSNDEYFMPTTLIGNTSIVVVTIENVGSSDLIVHNVFIVGKPGILDVNVPSTIIISPGTFITFDIMFTPEEAIQYSKKLKINSNDPDSDEASFNIIITGIGL